MKENNKSRTTLPADFNKEFNSSSFLAPLTTPLPHETVSLLMRSISLARRDRRSGDEALGRKPFVGHLLRCKPMKRTHLLEAQFPITLNGRVLKLRSLTVCAVWIYSPCHDYNTVSKDRGKGNHFSSVSVTKNVEPSRSIRNRTP
jgi:hypothetical protein